MYLMYVDESGSTTDPTQKYFVLSGIAVFERNTHWIEKKMNVIASQFCQYSEGSDPYFYELHGSPMRSGKSEWRGIPMSERINAIQDCLKLVQSNNIRIFAAVIEQGYSSGQDTITECFEQISSRFDMYLSRLHAKVIPKEAFLSLINHRLRSQSKHLQEHSKIVGILMGNLEISQKFHYFLTQSHRD